MNEYYTYAYLREDGTPYYIGKGKNDRITDKNHKIYIPSKERRIYLKRNLTEQDAFKHEIYMIAILGRKDLGTGILRNRTDGGDGRSGAVISAATRKQIGDKLRGIKKTEEHKRKISETKKLRSHKPMLGRKLSDEAKKKLSEAKRGKKNTKEHCDNMAKAFALSYKLTFTDGRELVISNMKQWCRDNKYHSATMFAVSKGKRQNYRDIKTVEKLSKTP